jgi:hypothetical protein
VSGDTSRASQRAVLAVGVPGTCRKLVDGENAFSVEFLALLRGHIRQQAEIICQVAAGFQAAVRMLYDFLVVRQITRSNPAHSVRGPKYVVKKGKTPVWSREDAKTLLDSIPKNSVREQFYRH